MIAISLNFSTLIKAIPKAVANACWNLWSYIFTDYYVKKELKNITIDQLKKGTKTQLIDELSRKCNFLKTDWQDSKKKSIDSLLTQKANQIENPYKRANLKALITEI